MVPWPVWPLAGHARLGQNTVVGFMTILLLALRGSVPRRVCLDPRLCSKRTFPLFSVELPCPAGVRTILAYAIAFDACDTLCLRWFAEICLGHLPLVGGKVVRLPVTPWSVPSFWSNRGLTTASVLAPYRHGYVVHQEVDQHHGPPHQTPIVFEAGLLQPGMPRFDSCRPDQYSDIRWCILLCSCNRNIS
jgi:hypothetical protein